MSKTSDYYNAVLKLQAFRAASNAVVKHQLHLTRKILDSVKHIYELDNFDDLPPEDKFRLKFFREIFDDLKESNDIVQDYNESVVSDYSAAMDMLAKIHGKSKSENQ